MKPKKYLALLLALATVLGLLAVPAAAAGEDADRVEYFYHVNPVYAEAVGVGGIETDLELIELEPLENPEFLELEAAGAEMRKQMVDRNTSFTVCVKSDGTGAQELISQILQIATTHTGVPTQGDYLAFQFRSVGGEAYKKPSGYQFNIQVSYYSTAEQEQTVNRAVESLMARLSLDGKSEYQKVKAIYDYICQNVVYDYTHQGQDNYLLQYTTYAALIDGTAVCQGYATLFYRLCLEAGLDSRLIPGTGNGGSHTWNIVKLGNYYYNVDTTWDACCTDPDSYRYFLCTDNTFGDHQRQTSSHLGVNYTDAAFYDAYPMDRSDYDPNTPNQTTHQGGSVLVGYVKPTCTAAGYSGDFCCAVCGGVLSYGTQLPAAGHSYDAGVITVPPTANTMGVVHYSCTACGESLDQLLPVLGNPFNDVAYGSYYHDAVLWAVKNGITNGTSATTFGPNAPCTRAQVVTFLWRSIGSPKISGATCAFTDVDPKAYYYDAMLWAVKNGITNGTSATTFGPNAPCTRAQVVTFLHRAQGSQNPDLSSSPFADVDAGGYYYKAMLWAISNGVTNGVDASHFGPNTSCNRAQIVTFLFRAK